MSSESLENDVRAKITNLLKANPIGLTIEEIAHGIGMHRHSVTKYIYELSGAKEIVLRPIGKAKICYLAKDYKTAKAQAGMHLLFLLLAGAALPAFYQAVSPLAALAALALASIGVAALPVLQSVKGKDQSGLKASLKAASGIALSIVVLAFLAAFGFQLFGTSAEQQSALGLEYAQGYLTASLKLADGQPLAGQEISFQVDGIETGRQTTDIEGLARLEMQAGFAQAKAFFAGAEGIQPSEAVAGTEGIQGPDMSGGQTANQADTPAPQEQVAEQPIGVPGSQPETTQEPQQETIGQLQSHATFACDSGTTNDVCVVSTVQSVDQDTAISGSGSLLVTGTGAIITLGTRLTITLGTNVTVLYGGRINATNTTAGKNGGEINITSPVVLINGTVESNANSCKGAVTCGKGGRINISAATGLTIDVAGNLSSKGINIGPISTADEDNYKGTDGGDIVIKAGFAEVKGLINASGGAVVSGDTAVSATGWTFNGGNAGTVNITADSWVNVTGRVDAYGGDAKTTTTHSTWRTNAGNGSWVYIRADSAGVFSAVINGISVMGGNPYLGGDIITTGYGGNITLIAYKGSYSINGAVDARSHSFAVPDYSSLDTKGGGTIRVNVSELNITANITADNPTGCSIAGFCDPAGSIYVNASIVAISQGVRVSANGGLVNSSAAGTIGSGSGLVSFDVTTLNVSGSIEAESGTVKGNMSKARTGSMTLRIANGLVVGSAGILSVKGKSIGPYGAADEDDYAAGDGGTLVIQAGFADIRGNINASGGAVVSGDTAVSATGWTFNGGNAGT
ncbi:MAG: hypothetical protein HY519_01665, partial [Candidatus Aenigmarchaeota archaeon]|nr:hypothetical protein [Candidatus Aenigmarchaeota archaeon]